MITQRYRIEGSEAKKQIDFMKIVVNYLKVYL